MPLEMGKSSAHLCYILFYVIAIRAIPMDCVEPLQSKVNVALFVFGDSMFDPGNNNHINTTTLFQANFLPYGKTFFGYATGRFSDGRLIPDFIAEYAKLPLTPAFLGNRKSNNWAYGANFASGGGGALLETHAGSALDLKTQLSHFENVEKELRSQLGQREAKQLLSRSVYLFSVGNNDLLDPSSEFSSYSLQDYIEIVIGNVTDAIKELHRRGARKFGFLSLVPLGCLPYIRAERGVDGHCDEEITSVVKLYNAAFSEKLKELEKQLKGFQYSIFDAFTFLMEMIDNPSEYGFKEVTSGCCGSGPFRGRYSCGGMRGEKEYELCDDPDEYLFFDSYHTNEKGHRLMAELMWHGDSNVLGPFNLKSFFQVASPGEDSTASPQPQVEL